MIDEIFSQSGNRILKIGSNYLCSRMDPRKEARVWVDAQKITGSFNEGIIIFGAGAGYHLVELRRRFPLLNWVVFESQMRSYRFVQQLFPLELFEIPIFSPDDLPLGLSHSVVSKILSGQFRIIIHSSSYQLNPDWYDKLKSYLLGRSYEGLQRHFHLRKGFAEMKVLCLSDNREDHPSWKIFDRMQTSELAHLLDRDYFLVKALRELIR